MENSTKLGTAFDLERIQAFSGQVVNDLSAGMSGVLVQIGEELGLYRAMRKLGPTNAKILAEETGTFERYVQEWLNNQAAGGYITYNVELQTYHLPEEHALVLADGNSPFFMAPGFQVVSSLWYDKDKIVKDFKEGKGIGWHQHHHNLFFGTEAFFRSGYRANLVSEWIPDLEGIEDKLIKGGKVADIGCGHGASTILMATKYPNSTFYGFDYHAESIETAKLRAKEVGLSNIVFKVASAMDFKDFGFDLICYMDAFHDFGNPLEALQYAKNKLNENGSIMLVEPASFDELEKNFNPIGRMFYAASTTLCVPHAHSQDGGYCLGAQAGPERVRRIVEEAGYNAFKIAQRTPVNLIYEIRK
ncbi:class I SAM-dependent methyltransferase [Allomuricauda sp. NBRC 101325]|uniref:class I SAM-dependent methyltransferase n=1 Tax=Allomuricauda sp. NBRC 101325 TaxID=1113758 RepID=UPI0025570A36|nr:class I SAM-dependent methyltransferase [Muricauda sp. NBRC 101325]